MPALAPKRLPFRRAARPARRRAVYPLLLALSGQAGVAFAVDEPVSLEAVTVNAYRPAETIGGSTKTDTPLRGAAIGVGDRAARNGPARRA